MNRLVMCACTACLILTIGAASPMQDAPKKKADDPQAAFEPKSAPGAGQALLKQFAGEWDVAKTFFPREGEPVRAKGTCRARMIHEGRFLQSDFEFEQAGKTTTGQGLIGFEPESGAFTSVWTDSRQAKMSLRQGKELFDGKKIVLYSASLEPPAKDPRRSKTISHLEDDGKTLIHQQFAIAPDGQERLMMELVMMRKK